MTQPPNSGSPDVGGQSTLDATGLTDAQIMKHLQICRELTLEFLGSVFPRFWSHWCDRLEEYAESARSNKEQTELLEGRRALVASEPEVADDVNRCLANGFIKFKNRMLNTLTGEERFSGDMLSLVEHSDLEETIAITSITHRADGRYAGTLWGLQQRLALLNGGEKLDERANPMSPVQFCEALRKALLALELDNKTKIIGYKVFEQAVIGELDRLYEDVNGYLIEQGLLPNLQYTAVVDESDVAPESDKRQEDSQPEAPGREAGGVPQRRASDRLLSGTANASDKQYQAGLYNAIRLLQSHIGHQPASGAPQPDDIEPPVGATPYHPQLGQAYSSEHLVGVLQALQAQALSQSQQVLTSESDSPLAPPTPGSMQSLSRQLLSEAAARSEEPGSVDSADLDTIDLVGLLFEYMLSDDNLPDSIKALLSYLHTPFLKMAFIDKDFFEQTDHPARVLLNSLAEAGARWVSNDGSSQYDMYNKIKTTVFRLLSEFKNDVRLFAEVLLEFNAYTNNLARRQELMERRALEKVQGEERLREAKQRVNDEVRQRTDDRALPSAVLLLLLQPWSDYLSFVILRYGENSDSWRQSLEVMDELLWTLEPKTRPEDKTRQLEMQEAIARGLQAGFESIGYDLAKGRKLLEAVASLQKMALQSRRPEPAPAPMRTKLENIAAQRVGHRIEREEPVTQEEQRIVDNLKMIEFGTWFESPEGKRVKVAWYNKRTLHYMLVDQQGRKVAMSSGLQLARDMIGGRTRIIAGSTKPFFERALENIYEQLNNKVSTDGREAQERVDG